MRKESFFMPAQDGKEIFVYRWLPETKPVAVVQISHGMMEHAGRYERFASALTEKGFSVYANDHRGHGKTAGKLENVGIAADKNGFFRMVDDMAFLTDTIRKENPALPVILFAHSMGSLFAQLYISKYADKIKALVLSGTSGKVGIKIPIGILI